MAFPTSYVQGRNIADALEGTTALDFNSDSFKVALFTNSLASFDSTAAEAYGVAPYNANEVSSSGYTAGGSALTTPGITVSSGKFVFDDEGAATLAWTGVTFTTRGCQVYDDTVSDLAVAMINFGSDLSPVADDFTITWDATNGVFYATFGTGS